MKRGLRNILAVFVFANHEEVMCEELEQELPGVCLLQAKHFMQKQDGTLTGLSHSSIDATKEGQSGDCPLPAGASWLDLDAGDGKKLKFACHTNPPSLQCTAISYAGTYEDAGAKMHQLASATNPAESTALDFGANVGLYSVLAAYYGFTVHAFEPLDENLALLRASLCANEHLLDKSRVKIHEALVGDSDGSCSVYMEGFSEGLGRMCCDEASCTNLKNTGLTYQRDMPILKLDTMLGTEIQGHIAFVKLDVEGGECGILKGGTKLLEPPFHPDMIQSEVQQTGLQGCTPREYLSRYSSAGYCVDSDWFQCKDSYDPSTATEAPNIGNFFMLSKEFKGHIGEKPPPPHP